MVCNGVSRRCQTRDDGCHRIRHRKVGPLKTGRDSLVRRKRVDLDTQPHVPSADGPGLVELAAEADETLHGLRRHERVLALNPRRGDNDDVRTTIRGGTGSRRRAGERPRLHRDPEQRTRRLAKESLEFATGSSVRVDPR
jgi:hypothetical protein